MMRTTVALVLSLSLVSVLACGQDAVGPAGEGVPVSLPDPTVLPVATKELSTPVAPPAEPAGGVSPGRTEPAALPPTRDDAPALTEPERTLHAGGFTVRTPFGWMYPEFDPSVEHYAIRCRPGGEVDFKSHWSMMEDDERVAIPEPPKFRVNGEPIGPGGSFVSEDWDSDHTIEVVGRGQGWMDAVYTLHCLPLDFPEVESWSVEDATVELTTVALVVNRRIVGHSEFSSFTYHALVDRNGVPRYHRHVHGSSTGLKPVSADPVRYGWPVPAGKTDDPYNDGNAVRGTYEIHIADRSMEVVDRVVTAGLRHTDNHDFSMTPDGNYLLLSYEPARRDMRPYGDYEEDEPTHDSIVQLVSPGGDLLLEWNSWDALAKEDCREHYFPADYSHVNSVEWVDGNVLVSLRGCSRVLMFDGATGETLWSVGPTTLSKEEHEARGFKAPLGIEGDPQGSFCGQHSAHLIDGERLVLYDNAVVCPTGMRKPSYSRVVEYEMDLEGGRIVWKREHRPLAGEDVITYSTGTVFPMENGHWLIGWGRIRYEEYAGECPVSEVAIPSVVEYDPDRGEELMRLHFRYGDCTQSISTRAWPVSPEMHSP